MQGFWSEEESGAGGKMRMTIHNHRRTGMPVNVNEELDKLESQVQDQSVCYNLSYRGGKTLFLEQMCGGCPHEVNDILHGTTGREWIVWYCGIIE